MEWQATVYMTIMCIGNFCVCGCVSVNVGGVVGAACMGHCMCDGLCCWLLCVARKGHRRDLGKGVINAEGVGVGELCVCLSVFAAEVTGLESLCTA